MIFTYNNFRTQISSNNLSIIKLQSSFNKWFLMDYNAEFNIYKEIYDNFIRFLDANNISSNFPRNLKNTSFGK